MQYSEAQISALSRELIKYGLFFYQLNFVWGHTPGLRNTSGTRYYFLFDDMLWTPRSLHRYLNMNWRPVAPAEVLFLQNRLDAHFSKYPQEIPEWESVNVSKILHQSTLQMEAVG